MPIRPATRTEVDRLLRVAADVWRRIGQLPRGGRADLPTLDAAIRSGALPLTKPLHALGVGAAFGIILAAELKLSWVLCDDYEPPQMALRRAEGKVPTITFPIDMIVSAARTPYRKALQQARDSRHGSNEEQEREARRGRGLASEWNLIGPIRERAGILAFGAGEVGTSRSRGG